MKIMMMRIKAQAITITCYHFLIIALSISMSLIVPTTGMTEEFATYEGTIQGLNCIHFQQKCPEKDLDMYIAQNMISFCFWPMAVTLSFLTLIGA